jgi:hypothetical protein
MDGRAVAYEGLAVDGTHRLCTCTAAVTQRISSVRLHIVLYSSGLVEAETAESHSRSGKEQQGTREKSDERYTRDQK